MLYSHKPCSKTVHFDRFSDREVTMLDLSRKRETLSIATPMGDVIQITVLGTTAESAMLGVDAPTECIILREDTAEH